MTKTKPPKKSDMYSQKTQELHFTCIQKALRNVNCKSMQTVKEIQLNCPLLPGADRQDKGITLHSKKGIHGKVNASLKLAVGHGVTCCIMSKTSHLIVHASVHLAPLKMEHGGKHQRSNQQPDSLKLFTDLENSPCTDLKQATQQAQEHACKLHERLHGRRGAQ